jgi:hypothetical protein
MLFNVLPYLAIAGLAAESVSAKPVSLVLQR